jgi:tetratricopeptide (TPR) repeat protein
MKKFLLIVIIVAIIAFSYKESFLVHRFYVKSFYTIFYTEEGVVQKAWELYNKGEYRRLEKFLDRVTEVYLTNNELKKIAGLNYIKLGQKEKGAELIASSMENGSIQLDELMKILESLFENKYYGEIIYFYDKNILRNNANCAFYYGASLYHSNRYSEAIQTLNFSRANGYRGDRIDFYSGITPEKMGKFDEAEKLLLSAYNANPYDRDIKKALVDLYRKTKQFDKAEYLLRKK